MAAHGRRTQRCSQTSQNSIPAPLASEVVWRSLDELKPYPGNPRKHPDSQIRALVRVIGEVGWTAPLLVNERSIILAGHGRIEAAKLLKMRSVPTLVLKGLSDAQQKAIVVADNRLTEKGVWDFDLLREQFRDLIAIDFDVELTGYSTGEIDLMLDVDAAAPTADPADDFIAPQKGPAATRLGDVWELGPHRILCGDALKLDSYSNLLGKERAEMVLSDVPYNMKINGEVCGRGRNHHAEFAMASGEMSDAEFTTFLETAFQRAASFSIDGSLHFLFIDWRHMPGLHRAAMNVYSDFKNLLIWVKSNAGQGSLYRSQHELVAVFKSGSAPHINNVELGVHGRNRSNVLQYPGGNTPNARRQRELAMHPTVKPVALLADLIRDCSRRSGIVLDMFSGSGSTILACERTGRKARAIEIEPAYVDLTITRWQEMTGGTARHAPSGQAFADCKAERCSEREAGPCQPLTKARSRSKR